MSFDGTNLTGTKWQFSETSLQNVDVELGFNIDFNSNGNLNSLMVVSTDPSLSYDGYEVYNYSGWDDDAYRTIEIISGSDVEYSPLISFLNTYAEFLGYADVTIEYGGNLISGMFDSGAKAIRTLGKFCTSDFIIRYTAPEPISAATINSIVDGTYTPT